MSTLRLIQRIEKLELEIQGIQIKLMNSSGINLSMPNLSVDIMVHIADHLNLDDLVMLRLVSKEFKSAADFILRVKSKMQLNTVSAYISSTEEEYAIIKNNTMPDIEENLHFLQDETIKLKIYSQFGFRRDTYSRNIMKCINTLYNGKSGAVYHNSRKFKDWFLTIDKHVDSITPEQIEVVEELIVKEGITYNNARLSSDFAFRLLIIVAAVLEVAKLKSVLNSYKSMLLESREEARYYKNLIFVTSLDQ